MGPASPPGGEVGTPVTASGLGGRRSLEADLVGGSGGGRGEEDVVFHLCLRPVRRTGALMPGSWLARSQGPAGFASICENNDPPGPDRCGIGAVDRRYPGGSDRVICSSVEPSRSGEASRLLPLSQMRLGRRDGRCCGTERISKIAPNKATRVRYGLKKCGQCKGQFTVRMGTIFEESKLPMTKWLQAMFLMTASKKGVSAHQLHRTRSGELAVLARELEADEDEARFEETVRKIAPKERPEEAGS